MSLRSNHGKLMPHRPILISPLISNYSDYFRQIYLLDLDKACSDKFIDRRSSTKFFA